MQAEVEGIDWSAVDDLSCGIELEVSGDARHQQPVHAGDHSDGKPMLLLFTCHSSVAVVLTVEVHIQCCSQCMLRLNLCLPLGPVVGF